MIPAELLASSRNCADPASAPMMAIVTSKERERQRLELPWRDRSVLKQEIYALHRLAPKGIIGSLISYGVEHDRATTFSPFQKYCSSLVLNDGIKMRA